MSFSWHLAINCCTVPVSVFSAEFEKPVRLMAGNKVISVESPGYAAPAFHDLDGDGVKDLLVGQFSGGKITVFRGMGDGKFKKGVPLKAGGADVSIPGVW